MYIKSRQGSEVLRTNYTVTDDINGVPTIETDELQLKDFHETPIKMLSPSLIDEFVLVIKDEAAASDSSLMKMIGVHRFIYDMNLSRVYDEYTQYFSIENILGLIFDGTEYTFEVKGDKTYYALMFENFGDKDKMSLIQQICSRWEVEYHISGTHVVFGDRRGSLTGNMFRYKMNILDSNINLDISKAATYIRGYFGKKAEEEGDEDTYVEKEFLHPLAEQYGKRDADPYSNENITQESTMNEYLKRKIEETWILSIEVEVSDLKGNGQVNVGDTVWAIDERLNIEMQTRVIKIVRYFDINDRVYKTKVTLGNYNFIDSVSNTDQTATDVLDKVVATNKKIESQMADFDNRFNKSRDEIIKEINDEFERQREEVEADFDAWKLYEEQARENIQQSVDGIVGEMDSIDTTIEEWQNTASSRFNALETDLEDKLGLHALEPFVNRLEANEQGISALFSSYNTQNLLLNTEGEWTVNWNQEEYFNLVEPIIGQDFMFSAKVSKAGARISDLRIKLYDSNKRLIAHDGTMTFPDDNEEHLVHKMVDTRGYEVSIIGLTSGSTSDSSTVREPMIERVKPGQSTPSLYRSATNAQLISRLEVNEENLDLIFGRVEGNETDIANFQMTADGLSSSVGTLRSDLDDMEQWSLAAGSDWQQTKDGFDRYVVANNETVDGLRTDVSNVVERADGISSTVSSMRGDVDDLEAWRADAGSKWEQTSQAITGRVWMEDIDSLTYQNENLIPHSENLWETGLYSSTTGADYPLSGRIRLKRSHAISVDIGKEYTLSDSSSYVSAVNTVNIYQYIDGEFVGTSGWFSIPRGGNVSFAAIGNEILVGLAPMSGFSVQLHFLSNGRVKTKLELGSRATPWNTSPKDSLQFTDFRLQADGFFLGTTFVGGSHYATAIVGDASGLKLIGDKISIDGNLDVLGKIRSEAINSVYANISEVQTRILIANSIKANMLDVTTQMAEKFYTHAAFINNASIKAANIRDLDAIKISASQITSGTLMSKNLNYRQNLNTGITDYYGDAGIRFNSDSNYLMYSAVNRVGWLSFTPERGYTQPAIVLGVNRSGSDMDPNSSSFAGFRAFSRTGTASIKGTRLTVETDSLTISEYTTGDVKVAGGNGNYGFVMGNSKLYVTYKGKNYDFKDLINSAGYNV